MIPLEKAIRILPGQYRDTESNLHYNYHRYYDVSIGRYLCTDPVGLIGGINPYSYCLNNPVMNVDLYGEWVAGAVIGFFSGGIGGITSGILGHTSLLSSITGGVAGGVMGALVGSAAGAVLPDFIGTPASAAIGSLAGGAVGGAIGGAVSSLVSTKHISSQAVLTGAAIGVASALIAVPGVAVTAWEYGSIELAMGLMGGLGGIMGDTVIAGGVAIWQQGSARPCGE